MILKTNQRTLVLELGLGGKFQANSRGWDENRMFLEGELGVGTSSSFRTSGPPNSCTLIAFIVHPPGAEAVSAGTH
jgi:hypothetical protein